MTGVIKRYIQWNINDIFINYLDVKFFILNSDWLFVLLFLQILKRFSLSFKSLFFELLLLKFNLLLLLLFDHGIITAQIHYNFWNVLVPSAHLSGCLGFLLHDLRNNLYLVIRKRNAYGVVNPLRDSVHFARDAISELTGFEALHKFLHFCFIRSFLQALVPYCVAQNPNRLLVVRDEL